MDCKAVSLSRHALQRMFKRSISPADVRVALETGEVIVDYPQDMPYPSRFILAFVRGRPLHILAARDEQTMHCYIVTTYVPDPDLWESDFRTRKPV